eukprot:Plantae.Rhodophyta-Purpureofilum_apyrenoidigerum.ctg7604.p1 GENE.Plantae.Rhodophyta-Purpureofilum_apyrenoidigerum.ctg7604~~Plantae.Rhodophyta-Purpureofilum_apyrenoidigerum.ctg7604.p1  ORF type:complete len:354 (-),score=76.79 Plantae.Rhodophyta-Purpureofilum_apyrenoidigerum.ctg7604:496-1557(-)
MVVGFGILGVAGISSVIAEALEDAPSAKLVATGSRSIEKAKEFAVRFGGKAYGSYDEVLDDPDVEAVYLPLPTGTVKEWVYKAIEKQKHIVVDKPLPEAPVLKKMIKACRDKGLVFMDGTHFVHGDRIKKVVEVIKNGEIGNVSKVNVAFSWDVGSDTNIRFNPALEPYGGLGDLGWYCVKVSQCILGFENKDVFAATQVEKLSKEGAVIACRGTVYFENKKSFAFDCSLIGSGYRQWVEAVGDKGAIFISDFVLPEGGSTILVEKSKLTPVARFVKAVSVEKDENGQVQFLIPNKREFIEVRNRNDLSQCSLMFEDFVEAMGDEELRAKWASEALATETILDSLYRAIPRHQ